MTKIEQLKEALNKIGFDIKGRYPNRYIYSANNKRTPFRVLEDRIEVAFDEDNDISYCCCFYFKHSDVELIDGDAVTIGQNGVFTMFYNHSYISED